MCFPEVELKPGDSIEEADEKVARAIEAAGGTLMAFEHLNTLFPTSSHCHFFQTSLKDRNHIVVVTSSQWEEKSVLAVLNILLNIRLDFDPPGPAPRVRFYSAHPVAPVLLTVFGDSAACQFESRAVMVSQYGYDLDATQSYQLGAVAIHLLRECLGIRTDFNDPQGEQRIAEALTRWFSSRSFPEDGAPINAVVVLGFLYGEMLRARLPYLSRWVWLKEYAPWPALAFGPRTSDDDETSVMGSAEAGPGMPEKIDKPQVIFSPLATVFSLYQGSPPSFLEDTTASLAKKCDESLGTLDET